MRNVSRLFAACLMAFLSACASTLPQVERVPSYAYSKPLETSVGQLAAAEAKKNEAGQSGFTLIREGRLAFAARVVMTNLAEKSLDIQYYIWEADTTGHLLAQRLIEAADRGVHVRLLLDDNNMQGRDHSIMALDAHPDIEVRVFNPFANREWHLYDFASDFGRVNHRMHNKVMIMDSTLAIVGGRNIGDHYFGVNSDANFRDLDLAAIGPVVRSLSRSFDYFWNGDWSYPIAGLVKTQPTDEEMRIVGQTVRKQLEESPYPYPVDADTSTRTRELKEIFATMSWAPGWVIANDPAAIGGDDIGIIKQASIQRLASIERELLIETAYFVQTDEGVARFAELVEQGVYVESRSLAAELKEFLNHGVEPANAYHVTLNAKGKLVWTAANEGKAFHFYKEPNTSWWQRFVADFIKLLPVESQL